jgi:hypothetical protein
MHGTEFPIPLLSKYPPVAALTFKLSNMITGEGSHTCLAQQEGIHPPPHDFSPIRS